MQYTRLSGLVFVIGAFALAAVGCGFDSADPAGEATAAFKHGHSAAGSGAHDRDADGGVDERPCDDADAGPHRPHHPLHRHHHGLWRWFHSERHGHSHRRF